METNDMNDAVRLPDGSGFAVVSFPLPRGHWSTADGRNVPPMPFRMGTDNPEHNTWAQAIRAAGRYAYRASTMNGNAPDLDPDALMQNFIVGLIGYWTPNGLGTEEWQNPAKPWEPEA